MLLVLTGVAAAIINGTTIYSGLGIGIMIMTDEITVVSKYYFSDELTDFWYFEIFGCDIEKVFAGLPMIVCGDFYQLPSVNSAPIYSVNATMKGLVTFKL